MRFHCDYCGTRYRADVDEARILGSRLVLTCKKCGRDIVAVGGQEEPPPTVKGSEPEAEDPLDAALDSALDQTLERMMKAQSEVGPWKLSGKRVDADIEELPIGEKTLVRSLERGRALEEGGSDGTAGESPAAKPLPAPAPGSSAVPEPEKEHESGLGTVRFAAIGLVLLAVAIVGWLVVSRGKDEKPAEGGARVPEAPAAASQASAAAPATAADAAAAPGPAAPAPAPTAAPQAPVAAPRPPGAPAEPKAAKETKAAKAAKAEAPAPVPPAAAAANPADDGEELPAAPSEEAVDGAFGKIVANARLCWIQGPGAEGKKASAGVTLSVAPTGVVTKVSFDGGGADAAALADCVRKAALRVSLPKFSGRAVEVRRTVSLGGS